MLIFFVHRVDFANGEPGIRRNGVDIAIGIRGRLQNSREAGPSVDNSIFVDRVAAIKWSSFQTIQRKNSFLEKLVRANIPAEKNGLLLVCVQKKRGDATVDRNVTRINVVRWINQVIEMDFNLTNFLARINPP